MKFTLILSAFIALQLSSFASGSRRPPKAPKKSQMEKKMKEKTEMEKAKKEAAIVK